MIYDFGTLPSQVGEIRIKLELENGVPGTSEMSQKSISNIAINYDMQGSKLGIFNIGDIKAGFADDTNFLMNTIFKSALVNNYRLYFTIVKESDASIVFNGVVLPESVYKDPFKKIVYFSAVDYVVHRLQLLSTATVRAAYPVMSDYYYVWMENMLDHIGVSLTANYGSFPTLSKTIGATTWLATFTNAYTEFLENDILNCSVLLRNICEAFGGIFYYGAGAYRFHNRTHVISNLAPTVLKVKKYHLQNPSAVPGIYYKDQRDSWFAGNQFSKNAFELTALSEVSINADATPSGGGLEQPIFFGDKFIQQAFDDVYHPFFIDFTRPFYELTVTDFVHPGMSIEYGGYLHWVVKVRNNLLQYTSDISVVQKELAIPS